MSAVAPQTLPQHPAASTRPLRVLIADDHPLIIAGIRRTIEPLADIQVLGEAHTGPELVRMIEAARPDAVVMDLRMPGVAGMEMIELIRRRWPPVRVIVLSVCDEPETIAAALEAGASRYVLKNARGVDLASVLRDAGAGVSSAPGNGALGDPAPPPLTKRERAILAAVATGMTTAAISRELWLSEHTIKFHLTNIYRKLGVPNRAGAVRWALENGLG